MIGTLGSPRSGKVAQSVFRSASLSQLPLALGLGRELSAAKRPPTREGRTVRRRLNSTNSMLAWPR